MGLRLQLRFTFLLILISLIFTSLKMGLVVHAEEILDTDGDGLYDYEESFVYHTSINNKDTDNDGFSDGEEVKSGYSPLVGGNKKMSEIDTDNDKLNDDLEIKLGTFIDVADSDGDGVLDGEEVFGGFDPLSANPDRLQQRKSVARHVEVDIEMQQLHYFLNNVELGIIPVSTGKRWTPTPVGEFKIQRKLPVHRYVGEDYDIPGVKWNLQFKSGYYLHGAFWHRQFGIQPMSHGCVNIAYKDVEKLYKFLDIGDKVVTYGKTPAGRVKVVKKN